MTQPQYVESTPAPVENASVWEDFVDIFYAPAAVFRRRENGNWFIPMLVVTISITIISFISYGALRPVYDAEYDRSIQAVIQANPQLTPEMMEGGRKFAEFTGRFGMIVIFPVMILLVALMMWLLGRVFGSKQTFRSAMVVSGYAQVPRVVGAIAMAVQGILMDPTQMTGLQAIAISPTRFVAHDAFSPFVYALLSRLDLFTIWATVLIAVGLCVTGKMSKGAAAATAFGVWFIASLPMVKNVVMARRAGL